MRVVVLIRNVDGAVAERLATSSWNTRAPAKSAGAVVTEEMIERAIACLDFTAPESRENMRAALVAAGVGMGECSQCHGSGIAPLGKDEGEDFCEACAKGREMRDEAEISELSALTEKLSGILTATANALKGPPGERSIHSWHDLAEVATRLVDRRWIACSERMPEATCEWYQINCYPYVGRFYNDKHGGGFYHGVLDEGRERIAVTHWMPLPEGPADA